MGISVKLFCNVQLFSVSVQRRISPFDFPVLFFIPVALFFIHLFIYLFIYLYYIKCCVFCSTMHSEICVMSVEMYLLNFFLSE